MGTRKQILIVLGTLLTVLGFQNCSGVSQPMNFTNATSQRLDSTEGNGQGYDGKVYLARGATCADQTNIHAKIVLKNSTSGSLVRENCQDISPIPLSATDFQINSENPDELTYRATSFTAQVPFGGIPLDLSKVTPEGGFRYTLIQSFGTTPDNDSSQVAKTQSKLQLYEDGIPMGPAHAPHVDIADLGQGRFSHWLDVSEEFIYFSATDNSNPILNGRVYSYKILP